MKSPIKVSDWYTDYEARLQACKVQQSNRLDGCSDSEIPHQLASPAELTVEDIVLAIVALEAGLEKVGIEHNFGDAHLYLNARHERKYGVACVGTSATFIMPLAFDQSSELLEREDSTNKEPAPKQNFGRFQRLDGKPTTVQGKDVEANKQTADSRVSLIILAFARFIFTGSIVVSYYDNSDYSKEMEKEAYVELQGIARRTARNLIRNSGWLRNSWPEFVEPEQWVYPARGADFTFGFHAILNAWCCMMDVKLKREHNFQLTTKFYDQGLELINLILAGKSDGMMIRSFLQCHGYALPEDFPPRKSSPRRLEPLNARSVLLNPDILSGIIKLKHEQEDPQKGPKKGRASRIARPEVISWRTKLEQGFNRHKETMKALKQPGTLRELKNMADENVFLAIACVWKSLLDNDQEFAFGTVDTFRCNRDENNIAPQLTAVLGPNRLIMPLLFNEEEPKAERKGKEWGGIGHHLLAVASIGEKKNKQVVEVEIFDSAPDNIDSNKIHKAVKGLVRYTGWLGVDAQGVQLTTPNPPVSFKPDHITPTQQGENTCGFYVILNAWATMLGIPITWSRERRPNTTTQREFYKEGLLLVNLALAGCMDAGTVQAYLNVHGYSDAQDPGDLAARVGDVAMTAMDSSTLEHIVHELRQDQMYQATQWD